MTTPQDLFLVSLDVPGEHPVEQGDLSLALAGAELVDLLGARALTLAGERIVPGPELTTGDRMLDEAGAALVRQEPYETVEDWLWRRGRGLAAAYRDALESAGQLTGKRRHWLARRPAGGAPADTLARQQAADRWWSREPVLAGLAGTLGIEDDHPAEAPTDEAVLTVLAAVGDAVNELEGVRTRRRIENAAFDNIWRAP
ncbi:GOLPH3/VPS74 family protein [Streptomyces broussonetiae]|uniref:GPP34 family phosphoprotein n=1 Tax=Streptomyces broussonetiae TaxID=2686304 RepID=A0A6I6NFL0_9ACTN|nr:GPP34 family phosphoprotein [Streptomyces broussonetiae]QHA07036.1 GPP34 family phosphoprotein [Streptomyces broussonetiae]